MNIRAEIENRDRVGKQGLDSHGCSLSGVYFWMMFVTRGNLQVTIIGWFMGM